MNAVTSDKATSVVAPDDVHDVLRRHMLLDGFDLVADLKTSAGCTLRDARTQKPYLDFFSFVASSALGVNHPKMMDPAFQEKLLRVSLTKVSNSDTRTTEQAEFVDTFDRVVRPDFMKYFFFIEGGTLGVENALKAAFDWKVRRNFARGLTEEKGHQVIHFREAFHGRSGYTLSLTNTEPNKTDYFPKFCWPRVDNPKVTFPLDAANLARVEKAEAEAVRQIEEAFERNPDDIAAILIEPIQGEGGDNHFRPEFFRSLRRLADEREAMLIFDEVQTGVGLTGRMWAYELYGVRPDMITFGKKMQVCGFLAGARLDEAPEHVFATASRINSTWGGNLTDMVRSQRILEIIEQDHLVDNARRVGEYLGGKVEELAGRHTQLVSNCRGAGLIQAFDLPDKEIRKRFLARVFELGLLMLPCGQRSVRLRPALIVGEAEVDQAIEILDQALRTF